ncbi:unnamed protein product [Spirodela intermedia]|uniref:Uncharacterized protein n=1 Tax=Spirodela intermedia TaxID=51605 RepID=A0A7I8JIU8_SPIIN|nr:unnamed protein product [Spirodela intermedia]CAA6670059.1 unnamed protein product [Spirodela intermedia]
MGWSCGTPVVSTVANLHCLPRRTPTWDYPALSSPSQLALSRCAYLRFVLIPAPRRSSPCSSQRGGRHLPKVSEYVFPDPIPEFAEAETDKFRKHMMERLSKKDIFGNSLEEIVGICSGSILSEFLHTEYGGPGTLLVIPFIDMADTINERGLPGGPQAARAAVVWAQKYVDNDWKEWTGAATTR